MKTLRLFGVLVLAVMLSINLTSCGDDDDDDNNSNPFVGTWLSTKSPGQTGDYYQIVFEGNGNVKGSYHLVDGKQDGGSISYSYTYDDASKAFTLTESKTKAKGYYTLSFNNAKTVIYLTFIKVEGDDSSLDDEFDLDMETVADFDWYKQ